MEREYDIKIMHLSEYIKSENIIGMGHIVINHEVQELRN